MDLRQKARRGLLKLKTEAWNKAYAHRNAWVKSNPERNGATKVSVNYNLRTF